MNSPAIQFALTSDGVRIAYTTWGNGPTLVVVPPIVSNVEMAWEHELYRRVFERMGQYVTVIAFDKRGIGMSDRFDEPPTNEHRIADFLAVMDAEGVHRAHISGLSEGGLMAQILAADHPDRVDRLVISNTYAPRGQRSRVERLAEGRVASREESMRRWAEVVEHWGQPSRSSVDWIMPSQADNEAFLSFHARLERQSATQAGFRRQLASLAALSTVGVPERITAPTLITHTTDDRVINVGNGRALAQLIPKAEFLEFPGEDHFYWVGENWRDIIDAQLRFITGAPAGPAVQRKFATVLFTDLVGSTAAAVRVGDDRWRATIEDHDRMAQRIVEGHHGHIVKTTGDGVLAVFDGPSLAIEAVKGLRDELRRHGLAFRAGLHAGEIEIRDGDIAGFAVHLAARVEKAAVDGEIYVTSTLRDLLLGGSFRFEDAGSHELKGFDGAWALYRLA
jgi:class 3 adenylate cyclase